MYTCELCKVFVAEWRWKVDKDDSRMRSIRMIHICLFAWSIRMIQHTTWRIVVKDYVFFFVFQLC
ncbi:hypothetical protein Hanom_Chr04g00345211 [Helianthus anomalus]